MTTAGNSQIIRTITILITIFSLSLPAYAQYSGGTGEPNDPYQIATAEDLMLLGESPEDYDKHFILTADIDLDPNLPGRKVFDMAVIAPDTNDVADWFQGIPFTGVLDGNGYVISHLTIAGGGYVGLFGRLGSGAYVMGVGVVEIKVAGSGWTACGLAGVNEGMVIYCFSTGVVSGESGVSGLVCFNYGTVTQCYSTSAVHGVDFVGGLVGDNHGTVTQCYSTGAVSGDRWVGGLMGYNYVGDVTASFWDIQTSGQTKGGGGTGKTTAQMCDIQTYLEAGWDFVIEVNNGTSQVWQMPERDSGYPVLAISNGYTPPRLQGLGTAEDPYLISNALELGVMVRYNSWAHYRLVTSIDLSGICWQMAVIPSFAGKFDGNGHVISHLTIDGARYLGLFGELVSGAEVRDLGITDVNIPGYGMYVGGLVGYSRNGNVIACHSTGVVNGESFVGGLVGYSNDGDVTECYSACTVHGRICVGGLVGYNDSGNVAESYSTSSVSGREKVGGLVGENLGTMTWCYSSGGLISSVTPPRGDWEGVGGVGGLVGENRGGIVSQCHSSCAVDSTGYGVGGLVGSNSCMESRQGVVTDCYSTGVVTGNWGVGGLVGRSCGTLIRCYSCGNVNGSDYVSGLLGVRDPDHGAVTCCFWNVETSGKANSDGGIGLTTAEMQTASTFLDAGWYFMGETVNGPNDVWKMWNGYDYPRLAWEPGPNTPLVFVDINDPGFYGQMSKYEVTNDHYCDFLNAALASGDITVDSNDVYGASGSNSGEDYAGQRYYRGDGSGYTGYGANNGGASRIHYNEGAFGVDNGFGNHPVTYVSWYGAMAFANYYGYYLPAEDQWQAVADYDGTYIYGCGQIIDTGIANYRDSEHPDGTTPVGSFGIYGYRMSDMAGNVWEWTSSSLDSSRVFRGGSLGSIDSDCDVSIRGDGIPHAAYYDIGFRVCR